jgi:hypothetical protein
VSLPERQQKILDQIEQVIQAADPGLRSMFSIFGRLTSPEAMPATEAMPTAAEARAAGAAESAPGLPGPEPSRAWAPREISFRRSARRILVLAVIVLSMVGALLFDVVKAGSQCPGLSSDQVVATAAVRYAACNHSTDAWSKGAR